MRRIHLTRFTRSPMIAAALSMGVVACGDDTTTPPANDTSVTDTSPEPDTTEDATGDTTPEPDAVEDTTPTDPCDPNPCTTAPGPRCDGNSVVTSAGPGTCTDNAGTASCAYTETTTACEEGEVCSAGDCVAAGNACEYAFDTRVSYVTEIRLTTSDDCCFDFDDDEEMDNDNGLGDLLANPTLAPILADQGFDINQTLADQIASGSLVLLLETKGLEDLTTDTDVTVNGFYGVDGDEDLTNNAAGTSTFKANQSAFIEGTASPYISFMGSTVTAGTLEAGPSLFNLNIPLLGANLNLAVEATRFEAAISEGALGAARGVAMGGEDGAKLGGYIALESVSDAFNTYLNASCTCITKKDGGEADPYVSIDDSRATEVRLSINIKNGTDCTEPEEDTCKSVGDALGQFGALLAGLIRPDIARDGLQKDAISVGVRIKATSADVSEVDMCVE